MGMFPGFGSQQNLAALASGPQNLANVATGPGAVPQQPAVRAPQYLGPGVDPSLYGAGKNVAPPTYIGPGVNPSLYPGANTGQAVPQPGSDLWSRLMNTVGNPAAGQFRMPGTTIGAPAGQTPPALPTPPPLPQGQMPMLPGANRLPSPVVPLGTYFQNQQFPQGGGNNSQLMQQYLALQQLMQR